MALLYIDKVTSNREAFEAKVKDIAQKLGVNPNDLMLIFYIESGINPQAQNTSFPIQGGYATGILQFAPDTARALGTSTDALLKMSNVEQLDYVYKYFEPYIGKIHSVEDLYLVTFFPAALGYSDDQAIGTSSISPASVAASNPGIDLNKDGKITILELKQYVRKKLPVGYQSELSRNIMYTVSPVTTSPFILWGIIILFLILIYLLYKRSLKK